MTAVIGRSYAEQGAWRALQEFLPAGLRMSGALLPEEELWPWRGHGVHIDRFRRPDSPVKVVLHHGVGTNGRQLSMILGGPLARRGIETLAVDNLGYGLTDVARGSAPTYDDWVELVVDLLASERQRDDRPIVLYGLSAGGMLAYHVAARCAPSELAGIVGMTSLDQRLQQVRAETSINRLVGRAASALGPLARTPAARLRVPMRWVSKMGALANDPGAMRVLLADGTSAGNSASVGFLASYLGHRPAVEPEDFDTCPVLLTQPAEDRWSPLHLSTPMLDRITRVPVTITTLDGPGHLPLEQPGLQQMHDAVAAFAVACAAR